MKKISTLFKKDPLNLALVTSEINPENLWVLHGNAIPTRKFDGTAAAIINGQLYKRYDVKKGRQVPEGAISCQEADAITGHHPHWVKCDREKVEDNYFFEGFDSLQDKHEGTYELVGPKVQGNPEGFESHALVKHGSVQLCTPSLTYEGLREFLQENDVEGIVFHNVEDGRMCKIRKSDFGIRREKKQSV